ncbi:possible carbamoyl phosphate synthase- inactivated [Renibacterium salmoninarum ATCC 33209]|uniref:Possible carbamoyl phosphate synthase-inactivated n=1 Tax=Renibacterium salmoninarum (strain ATCC 33209 / DSM 20767 / JCM 11484 / NBRC 15589 / NCIMB 2235) TaxID=288705 RepID=A9WUX3_RENSM|nr:carbamoyl phosphate synthase- inactivated [Renibacterium salmoninarum]ABY24994.1 possible carbamoyl phosphate synthase- inactivated [Renibacterium salmoninarum ATCC 33209]
MTAVVITGGRAPVAVELAKSFSDAGFKVIGAESRTNLLSGSKFANKSYRVPAPRWDPLGFADAITGIARLYKAELIVPCCEEVFWLAEAADRPGFEELAQKLFGAKISTLRRLHQKADFVDLLQDLDEPAPQGSVVSSRAELVALRRGKQTAAILKPVFPALRLTRSCMSLDRQYPRSSPLARRGLG